MTGTEENQAADVQQALATPEDVTQYVEDRQEEEKAEQSPEDARRSYE